MQRTALLALVGEIKRNSLLQGLKRVSPEAKPPGNPGTSAELHLADEDAGRQKTLEGLLGMEITRVSPLDGLDRVSPEQDNVE